MSADGIIFNPVFPLWATVIIAAVLLTFFIYNEIKRSHRFIAIRILAQIVIILSLVALIVRPSIKNEKTIGSALLLTKGYEKDLADSLVDKYHLRTLRMYDAVAYPKSKVLHSWHELGESASDIRFVIGEGIPSFALAENNNLHFDFIGHKKLNGVVSLEFKSLKANQRNIIHGQYYSSEESTTLKLNGPAGMEDSIKLKKGLQSFSLKIKTARPGNFVYQLNSESNQQTIINHFPVQVEAENKLSVVFLQQYPTFETKYLKNYLSEKGHAITLRYQISKNTYRYEYANQDKQLVPKLTSELLNSLDLLVLTTSAFQDLSINEVQTLEQSIKKGLGVLLLFDQKTTKNIQRIFPFLLTEAQTDTVSLSSPSWAEKITVPAIPLRINTNPAVQSLFKDSDGKILSGYFYNGTGRTGFQFLNETYRLSLEGKANEYADFWSPLIENIARTKAEKFKIKIVTPFPRYIDQPIDFKIMASAEAPEVYYDSIRLPVKEDVRIENIWHGTTWANQSGWHRLTLQDSTQFDFYVSANQEWNDLRVADQIKKNSLYQASGEVRNQLITDYQPVSPLLFFLLFILASGTLWLLAKI